MEMDAGALHRLARQLREAALAATADPCDDPVSYGMLAIVEDLARHPGSTVGEVAGRVNLAQSLVSRISARLRAEGIVDAERDPADRRRTRLRIDPAVRRRVLRTRGARRIGTALAATFPHLDAGQVAGLEKLLDQVGQLVETGDADQGRSR